MVFTSAQALVPIAVSNSFEGKPPISREWSEYTLFSLGDDLSETHARLTPTGKLGNQLRVDAVDAELV